MNSDANGVELVEGDKVILVGTITSIDSPISGRSVLTVEVIKKGETVGLSCYSDELIKASIDHTISGALGGNT